MERSSGSVFLGIFWMIGFFITGFVSFFGGATMTGVVTGVDVGTVGEPEVPPPHPPPHPLHGVGEIGEIIVRILLGLVVESDSSEVAEISVWIVVPAGPEARESNIKTSVIPGGSAGMVKVIRRVSSSIKRVPVLASVPVRKRNDPVWMIAPVLHVIKTERLVPVAVPLLESESV